MMTNLSRGKAISANVLGLKAGDMLIQDEKRVTKPFPDFWERLESFY